MCQLIEQNINFPSKRFHCTLPYCATLFFPSLQSSEVSFEKTLRLRLFILMIQSDTYHTIVRYFFWFVPVINRYFSFKIRSLAVICHLYVCIPFSLGEIGFSDASSRVFLVVLTSFYAVWGGKSDCSMRGKDKDYINQVLFKWLLGVLVATLISWFGWVGICQSV